MVHALEQLIKKQMLERIVVSIVAVVALGFTLSKGDVKTKLLTAGLTTGILITWTS